jgi:D-glycero-D-manno-heptose 1,7-bisphosphate phosphatase
MFQVGEKPFLEHQIIQAKEFGFRKVLILAGYLGETISNYFHINDQFDIDVKVLVSDESLSTKLRLLSAINELDTYFCLVYGDNLIQLLPFEINSFFTNVNNELKFIAYQGKGYHSVRNIIVDHKGNFLNYKNTNDSENPTSMLNLGWYLLSKSIVSNFKIDNTSLENELFNRNSKTKITVFRTFNKYYSVGNLNRLASLERFLDPRRRVVLLDRDGTINVKAPKGEYVVDERDFIWKKGVKEVLTQFELKNKEFYILTNQPAVGRNLATKEQVDILHTKLYENFLKSHLNLKGIVTCYHGWYDSCTCRKPGIGLFLELQETFDLNWKNTVYIGDDERDYEAAYALGLSFIHVTEHYSDLEADLSEWVKKSE